MQLPAGHLSEQYKQGLEKVAQVILWSLDSKSKAQVKVKQYMISFHSSKKALCEKIQAELEKSPNVKVVLNLCNSLKSNIDTSIKTIEKSECVLLGVCERYRVDENAQAEATYAYNTRKHIVPLIMQEGFEHVDGWMSPVLKDRVCIDFTGDFEEACANLVAQLHTPTLVMSKNVENWTQAHVSKWFVENKIHASICQLYEGHVDGVTLVQIYKLKTQTPEFFYQSLLAETQSTIKTSDIAHFNAKLELLFQSVA